jgi:hypothetical protein
MAEALQAKHLTQPGMQIIVPNDIIVDETERNLLAGFVVVKMLIQVDTWKRAPSAIVISRLSPGSLLDATCGMSGCTRRTQGIGGTVG